MTHQTERYYWVQAPKLLETHETWTPAWLDKIGHWWLFGLSGWWETEDLGEIGPMLTPPGEKP